ncbi:hypothetical protein PPYR_10341 [Photinus pyralis]|uniref:Secreted protein n=1 Tax=Photinus pyralis TaxID=7054 RepID=A0A5N4AG03_PHOPY|nr:hypothetical protein PPYR_10341 [Photinus pyralis]
MIAPKSKRFLVFVILLYRTLAAKVPTPIKCECVKDVYGVCEKHQSFLPNIGLENQSKNGCDWFTWKKQMQKPKKSHYKTQLIKIDGKYLNALSKFMSTRGS